MRRRNLGRAAHLIDARQFSDSYELVTSLGTAIMADNSESSPTTAA